MQAVTEARATAEQTASKAERLLRALTEAQSRDKAAQAALRQLLREENEEADTMSRAQVAEYLGIAQASVPRQMQRWGIKAVYVRGPRRAEARYPTAEVTSRAANRPGRGHRSDLHDADA